MYSISKKVHNFLIERYEKAVEKFFDDPLDYSDGEPLKSVFNELKSVGEELEIDILSLALKGDLDNLEELMEQEEDLCFPEITDFGSEIFDEPEIKVDNSKENSSVEEKLKMLSKENQQPEIIGEWATYDIEE